VLNTLIPRYTNNRLTIYRYEKRKLLFIFQLSSHFSLIRAPYFRFIY